MYFVFIRKNIFEIRVLELYIPSRNTDQGVFCYGEPKSFKLVSEGKPTFCIIDLFQFERRGLKGPLVIAVRLESGRS